MKKTIKTFFDSIYEFEMIKLGWNDWNGFYFDVLKIELIGLFNIDSSILGLHISKYYIIIHLLYFSIDIKKPKNGFT